MVQSIILYYKLTANLSRPFPLPTYHLPSLPYFIVLPFCIVFPVQTHCILCNATWAIYFKRTRTPIPPTLLYGFFRFRWLIRMSFDAQHKNCQFVGFTPGVHGTAIQVWSYLHSYVMHYIMNFIVFGIVCQWTTMSPDFYSTLLYSPLTTFTLQYLYYLCTYLYTLYIYIYICRYSNWITIAYPTQRFTSALRFTDVGCRVDLATLDVQWPIGQCRLHRPSYNFWA